MASTATGLVQTCTQRDGQCRHVGRHLYIAHRGPIYHNIRFGYKGTGKIHATHRKITVRTQRDHPSRITTGQNGERLIVAVGQSKFSLFLFFVFRGGAGQTIAVFFCKRFWFVGYSGQANRSSFSAGAQPYSSSLFRTIRRRVRIKEFFLVLFVFFHL